MAETRRVFTDGFKNMITELAVTGKAVREICSEYSLNETVVCRWIKDRKPHNVDAESITIEKKSRSK